MIVLNTFQNDSPDSKIEKTVKSIWNFNIFAQNILVFGKNKLAVSDMDNSILSLMQTKMVKCK